MSLYVGLMSGTSLDGVDGVLAQLDGEASGRTAIKVVAHHQVSFPEDLRTSLLRLNSRGDDELHLAALAANALVRIYAGVVDALLRQCGVSVSQVDAIGAHGQTVRHRPQEFDGTGYTLQLMNGALLAELCGIDVVCDLRSRDVAAGGQGAPLVPALHAALFAVPGEDVAVLNLGGIGNLTLLPAEGPVRGFDCGPGNALAGPVVPAASRPSLRRPGPLGGFRPGRHGLAAAPAGRALPAPRTAQEHRPRPFQCAVAGGRDAHVGFGAFACRRAGHVDRVQRLRGRKALKAQAPKTRRLLVCGGGAFNDRLMQRLAAHLAGTAVGSTAAVGISPLQVEALAFAWLAQAFVSRRPGNLAAVTGARGPRVLGALYPAS